MTYRHFFGWALAGLLIVWLLVGCHSEIRSSVDSSLSSWAVVHQYRAAPSLLQSPYADVNSLDVNDVVEVSVSVLPLHVMPDRLLSPAGPYTRTMTISPNAQFVTPVLKYSEGARIGPVANADTLIRQIQKAGYGRVQLLDRTEGVLPVAVEWATQVTESQTRESLTLQIIRQTPPVADANEGADLDLVLSHGVFEGPVRITERLLLQHGLLAESPCWALIMPCHHPVAQVQALALICQVGVNQESPRDPNERQAALAQCLEQVGEDLAQQTSEQAVNQMFQQVQQAVPQLRWPARQRGALHYITRQSPFAHELVMAAPRPLIQDLARAVVAAFDQNEFPTANIPWTLERLAYGVVLQSWEKGELSPAVQALLTVHTGQVGRDLTTLRSVLQQSTGLKTFENQLKQENTIYLQDISPAARVRAYQWLLAHKAAPPGFDPLGTAQQRRASLAAAATAPLSSPEQSLEKDVR